MRIVETFAGIGSQVQALKNINQKVDVVATVEWDITAMYAYDIMHHGPQDYRHLRHHTKDSLIEELSKYSLSGDSKKPLSYRSLRNMNIQQLKSIYVSIERNHNLVDISKIHAQDLPETDILTYSFPCQDLSVSGYWHNNKGGIDRDANNRSTLLWQIERLLIELKAADRFLPKYLLMENVSNILSKRHIKNFNEWCSFLEKNGYYNVIYTLNSKNFGIPQSRERTFMLSIQVNQESDIERLDEYFFNNNLESKIIENRQPLSDFLKVDYEIEKYRLEAIDSTPHFTPSREKIFESNTKLAKGNNVFDELIASTVTTKQDRHPNSGIIEYDDDNPIDGSHRYRNLTPRECFLLMGFDEQQFDLLMENNFDSRKNTKFLSTSKLIRLAGNSIVIPVLEEIFKQVVYVDENILNNQQAKM